jgi:hypothetical protein
MEALDASMGLDPERPVSMADWLELAAEGRTATGVFGSCRDSVAVGTVVC